MIRLFIALKIDEEIQNKFDTIISDFKTKGGKVKWIDSKNLHITLKFLGNTEPKLIDTIISQIQYSVGTLKPFESDFSALGGFPNLRKPKVIWANIAKHRNNIIELAENINHSLAELNIEKHDKPFQPHLTLGRVKSYESLTELTDYLSSYQFEKIDITCNTIQLIKSTLTQHGPIYKTLQEINLTEKFGD